MTGPAANQSTISGTPTTAGSFFLSIQLSDHTGSTVTNAYSILVAQPVPSICIGCIVNGASFAKNAAGQGTPVAPGSVVAIFTSPLATAAASIQYALAPPSLSGVSVKFNSVPAPIISVTPGSPFPFVAAQIPFEVF